MRPSVLIPLFASATSLAGIGPRMQILLKKALRLPPGVTEPRIVDLLWHTPAGVIDRRATPTIAAAVPGTIATLAVRVLRHRGPPQGNAKAPYKVGCEDETGRIDLVFFHADPRFIQRQLPEGSLRFVSGRVDAYNDKKQMAHPDYIVAPEARAELPMLEPVYPLTAGLSGKVLLKAVRGALEKVPELPEWQDQAWLKGRGWPDWKTALARLHQPAEPEDVSAGSAPWQRLAFDELLAGQLALGLVRLSFKQQPGRSVVGDGRIRARIADALPFALTNSQRQALKEIAEDISAPFRMLRLLQGDVGSGKTVVALMAMAIAVEAGAQAALMAPTEVLARQHAETVAPLADHAGLTIGLLTGREKGKAREALLTRLKTGEIDILIGTHALFQADVAFKDLAFAVIDEQHRFGVHQRLALQMKGGREGANLLVMTATPIPRTLLMTHYGDLEVSRLTEKPAGRKPIVTRMVPVDSIARLIERLARAAREGRAGLLGVPADRELRPLGAGRRRGARGAPGAGAGRRQGGAAARRHVQHGQGRDHGGVRRRAPQGAGGDDGDRGGRQRAQRQHHGDRARRALRPGAVAPAARPGGARHPRELLHAPLQGAAGRDRAPAPGDDGAHRGRLSRSPRRTWSCAAAARCWARASRACPSSASPRCRASPTSSPPPATTPAWSWGRTRS